LDFIVRKRQGKPAILFVIAVSLFFQLGASHSYYESLVEADFLGHGLKFEAADLENLFVDKQKSLEINPKASSFLCSEDINPSEQFFPPYFQAPSADQTSITLRC
jgi:hypothetical protein